MVKIQSDFGRFFDANRAGLHYEIYFLWCNYLYSGLKAIV